MKVIRFHSLLALTLTAHAAISSAEDLAAFFVDCAGQYITVSATTGQIEGKGKVQDIDGAGMPSGVRDGCSVRDVRIDESTSTVIMIVQNFVWESDDAKPPYFNLTLSLPDLRLVKREPVQEIADEIRYSTPELDAKQKAFLTGLGKGPFESQAVMWSSNGRFAIVAEIRRDPRHSFNVFPRMSMGGDLFSTLTLASGRFIAYNAYRNEEIGRYEISGLRMDLFRKTLMSPDGSFVFHCYSDEEGQRKLFLVRIAPKSSVTEIEYGNLDPWWSGGLVVPSQRATPNKSLKPTNPAKGDL